MTKELPATTLPVLSGLLTAYFGVQYYFFPALPADANALNKYDAVVKGTIIMHIGLMMLVAAYLFWKKNPSGIYFAWFIGILINSVGLLIYFKTKNFFVLSIDMIRGLLLITALYFYSKK